MECECNGLSRMRLLSGRYIGRRAKNSTLGLLLLELGDGLDAAGFGHGESNLVAGLHGVEYQPVLYLEFLGGSAAAGADSAALRLLDRDLAAGFVDLADRARHGLLRERARTGKDGKRRTGENDFCCLHVRLPTLAAQG